jgi:hypothetical protein
MDRFWVIPFEMNFVWLFVFNGAKYHGLKTNEIIGRFLAVGQQRTGAQN